VLVAVVVDEPAAVREVLELVELGELAEWLEPPQDAISNQASTVAQSARRGIGAL
jgi:hypothetical protein